MTDELVEWLRAQLDEDERVAREAPQDNDVWQAVPTGRYSPAAWVRAVGDEDAWMVGEVSTLQQARHIARHDPARVLREVEAKRRLLDYLVDLDDKALDGNWWNLDRELPFQLLALPFADRPGYRSEWAP